MDFDEFLRRAGQTFDTGPLGAREARETVPATVSDRKGRRGPSRVRRVDHDAVAEDYATGHAVADIARRHGCSEGHVSRIVRALGLPMRRD